MVGNQFHQKYYPSIYPNALFYPPVTLGNRTKNEWAPLRTFHSCGLTSICLKIFICSSLWKAATLNTTYPWFIYMCITPTGPWVPWESTPGTMPTFQREGIIKWHRVCGRAQRWFNFLQGQALGMIINTLTKKSTQVLLLQIIYTSAKILIQKEPEEKNKEGSREFLIEECLGIICYFPSSPLALLEAGSNKGWFLGELVFLVLTANWRGRVTAVPKGF